MTNAVVERVVELARRVGDVLVATADGSGLPHVAVAQDLGNTADGRLAVTAWYCPGTAGNVEQNPRIALVVWERNGDVGYQIIGRVQAVRESDVMDGYDPAEAARDLLPQIRRTMVVNVERVLHFSRAPHADTEI